MVGEQRRVECHQFARELEDFARAAVVLVQTTLLRSAKSVTKRLKTPVSAPAHE
jgi:hypothetical protein